MIKKLHSCVLAVLVVSISTLASAANFEVNDVFGLEYAADPQISPDGKHIVYVRKSMDIMKDRGRSNLWIIDSNGENHRAIASSTDNYFSPRWSSSGDCLVYASNADGS